MAENYSVQFQRQLRYWDDNQQRLVDGMVITFAIADGQVGELRVPLSQYTPENVAALIEARVSLMHGVARL